MQDVIANAGPSYVQAWNAIDANDPDAAEKLLREIRAQDSGVPDEDVLMLEASIMGLRGLHRQCAEFLEKCQVPPPLSGSYACACMELHEGRVVAADDRSVFHFP